MTYFIKEYQNSLKNCSTDTNIWVVSLNKFPQTKTNKIDRGMAGHSALEQNPNKKNVSDIPSMVSGSIQWIH